ncbi:ABC transporter ATP-binding protein [Prosthecobacter sp.]|uniref:ABC transporter ATP-binding protein n=1 Tax=Prosthecobacter sp. TaxID=1965333 RepID=UPI002AC99EAF|nr:ABC transporter ATP-binding protein [Prosthecobacter sp.]
MKAMWKYMLPYRGRFALSLMLGMLSAVFNGVMLIGFQLIFSLVLKGQTRTLGEPTKLPLIGEINIAQIIGADNDTPVGFIGVMIACSFIPVLIFLRGFLGYLSSYMQAWVTSKVVYQIRSDAFRSVLRQSPGFFNSAKTGELMQTVTSQTSVVQRNAMMLIQTLAQRPLTIISILVVLFAQDWLFTLMSLIVFPACLVPIIRIGKRVRKNGAREEYDARALMVAMQESFAGIRLVKSYAREDHAAARFDRANASMTRNMVRWTKAMELVGPIVETVASFGIAAGLVYAWERGLEAENFFLLVMALTQIYPPVKELSRVQMLLQKTTIAAGMVFELLERRPDIEDSPGAVDIGRATGAASFQNVTFFYRDKDGVRKETPAVRNIQLQLDPGKFYAFVGPSGAGKSTLYSLLLRFYDPDQGAVMLDGRDVRSITQDSLRANIGVVSQDTFLFHDTIRENIRYGRLNATEDEIIAAAQKAHAHEFVTQIAGGYNAIVGEGGCNLSGGQKQRISIARAILRDAPILLLDEATSALDTESEKIIQEAIHLLSEGRTVVAIAHRLSTILEADQIVVMEHGCILDCGTHAELLDRCPLYQKLYHLQFSGDERREP